MSTNSVCSVCERRPPKPKVCSKCHLTPYCSKECQRKDWKRHKVWCERIQKSFSNREASQQELDTAIIKEQTSSSGAVSGGLDQAKGGKSPVDISGSAPQEQHSRGHAINPKAEEEMEKSNAKKKGKKKQKSVTEENSEVGELETQLMRDKQLKQLRQKEEEEKRKQLQRFQCQVSPDGSVEPEMWEKKWKQSKRIPSLAAKGQPSTHAMQHTHYRVGVSNTAPVLHEGFRRNPDNTNSYEEEIEEKQPDGTITRWKTIITNGVIENDAQLEEITRQFGVDFSHHPGGTLADPD